MRLEKLELKFFPIAFHPKLRVNVFYVEVDGIPILIDAGGPFHGKKIVKWLERNHFKPKILLITHSHIDHYGGAAYIHTVYPSIKIFGPAAGQNNMRQGRNIIPANLGRAPKPFTTLYKKLLGNWHIPGIGCDGDGHELESHGIKILPTPGHSPDHTSILLPDGVLISGDAVAPPPLWFEPFYDDEDLLRKSVEELAKLPVKRVLPSHYKEFAGPIRPPGNPGG